MQISLIVDKIFECEIVQKDIRNTSKSNNIVTEPDVVFEVVV